jgi:hypothetical protein
MPGRNRRASASDLSRAIVRFKKWRQGRVSRTRIPVALWTLAVKVAGRHGVSRTAAALKLDYYALKDRLLAQPVRAWRAAESTSPGSPEAGVGDASAATKTRDKPKGHVLHNDDTTVKILELMGERAKAAWPANNR